MKIVMLLLTLSLVPGCAMGREYRLHTGDTLKVVIFGEMDEQALVRPDHRISLPIVGEISTHKKTAAQLSRELTDRYQMTTVVMVQEYRTWKDTLKESLGLARDVFLILFALQRLAND